jgi:hypothetical protein
MALTHHRLGLVDQQPGQPRAVGRGRRQIALCPRQQPLVEDRIGDPVDADVAGAGPAAEGGGGMRRRPLLGAEPTPAAWCRSNQTEDPGEPFVLSNAALPPETTLQDFYAVGMREGTPLTTDDPPSRIRERAPTGRISGWGRGRRDHCSRGDRRRGEHDHSAHLLRSDLHFSSHLAASMRK